MSLGAKSASARHIQPFTAAKAGRPWWMRGVNALGRLAPDLGKLSADAVWEEAQTQEGAAGDPSPDAVAALGALVGSIHGTAALNTIGRLAAREDTVRMARTHLRVERATRKAPSILDEQIPSPLFIVGWPRTGSTALHTLLAEDPRSRTIPYWESFDPVPPERGPDRRVEDLDRMLAQLERFSPDYHAIHPMAPEMTEECVALFMNHFRTLQFGFQYRVPEYTSWLLEEDPGIAYAAYHRSLRLVHHFRPGGDRFVLKDPTHLVHLETILSLWPHAKVIFTHRDPAVAISSLCSLHAHTRAIFSDDVDAPAIGREVMAGHWPRALDAAFARREQIPRGQLADVRHVDLLRDPIGTVERVYAELNEPPLTDAARVAMQRFVAEEARKPVSVHEHSAEGFGLAGGAIRERFQEYTEHFDL